MPKLTVDNVTVEVEDGCNLLQACEAAGVEIPRFCYHEGLSVAGNCRMCLVQVEKIPKPVASCAMPATSGMVVYTNNDFVRKARQAVMEFLLINHPLDCPICDQGGECDLQDQSYIYGLDKSRFALNKRAVEDKYIGPLVKTVMNRCIHCTRCVRFSAEVAGVSELGATGRGEDMEITTYLETAMQSELSGNVIDLCPVGALTSKPYQFKARSWELQKTETIDTMDAMAMPIRVDSRGSEILRILPREDDRFDETWISDKTRFVYDAFKANRLDRAYVRQKNHCGQKNIRIEVDYLHALDEVAKQMKGDPQKKAVLVGDLSGAEEIFALKKLTDALSINNRDCRLEKNIVDPRLQGENVYRFNSGFDAIEDADLLLLIGTNPRHEAPVLNAMIRKKWLHSDLEIALIGEKQDLTYPIQHLGQTADVLSEIASGKHPYMKKLILAKKPLIIIAESACNGDNGKAVLAATIRIAKNCNALPTGVQEQWFGFNMLPSRIGVTAALNMQFLPVGKGYDTYAILQAAAEGKIDTLYLLGYDNLKRDIPDNVCVIYQGSHAGKAVERADIILPSACYVEKNSTYLNAEARALKAYRAVFPLGEAREDWAVIRALAEKMQLDLGFNSLEQLREKIYLQYPEFTSSKLPEVRDTEKLLKWSDQNLTDIDSVRLPNVFTDFYQSNVIAQNSLIMQECSDLRKQAKT